MTGHLPPSPPCQAEPTTPIWPAGKSYTSIQNIAPLREGQLCRDLFPTRTIAIQISISIHRPSICLFQTITLQYSCPEPPPFSIPVQSYRPSVYPSRSITLLHSCSETSAFSIPVPNHRPSVFLYRTIVHLYTGLDPSLIFIPASKHQHSVFLSRTIALQYSCLAFENSKC